MVMREQRDWGLDVELLCSGVLFGGMMGRKDGSRNVNWKIRNGGQSRRVYISWGECCITHG